MLSGTPASSSVAEACARGVLDAAEAFIEPMLPLATARSLRWANRSANAGACQLPPRRLASRTTARVPDFMPTTQH
jgi:hypothetical protein